MTMPLDAALTELRQLCGQRGAIFHGLRFKGKDKHLVNNAAGQADYPKGTTCHYVWIHSRAGGGLMFFGADTPLDAIARCADYLKGLKPMTTNEPPTSKHFKDDPLTTQELIWMNLMKEPGTLESTRIMVIAQFLQSRLKPGVQIDMLNAEVTDLMRYMAECAPIISLVSKRFQDEAAIIKQASEIDLDGLFFPKKAGDENEKTR